MAGEAAALGLGLGGGVAWGGAETRCRLLLASLSHGLRRLDGEGALRGSDAVALQTPTDLGSWHFTFQERGRKLENKPNNNNRKHVFNRSIKNLKSSPCAWESLGSSGQVCSESESPLTQAGLLQTGGQGVCDLAGSPPPRLGHDSLSSG